MKINIAKDLLRRKNHSFNTLFVITLFLLISNTILTGLVFWFALHKQVIISPPVIKDRFSVSAVSVDANYLKEMSLLFLFSRLNITPETVEANHRMILEYVDPAFYHILNTKLLKEADYIKYKRISSVFYCKKIIANPNSLEVRIDGNLRRWVGGRSLDNLDKTYLLIFSYDNAKLLIRSFTELSKD